MIGQLQLHPVLWCWPLGCLYGAIRLPRPGELKKCGQWQKPSTSGLTAVGDGQVRARKDDKCVKWEIPVESWELRR